MSGFPSTTATFNQAKAPWAHVEREFDDTDTADSPLKPAFGIALAVALSVPLWGLLAWAAHFVITAV